MYLLVSGKTASAHIRLHPPGRGRRGDTASRECDTTRHHNNNTTTTTIQQTTTMRQQRHISLARAPQLTEVIFFFKYFVGQRVKHSSVTLVRGSIFFNCWSNSFFWCDFDKGRKILKLVSMFFIIIISSQYFYFYHYVFKNM